MRIAKGDLYTICSQQGIKEPNFLEALDDLCGIDEMIQEHQEGTTTSYSILES